MGGAAIDSVDLAGDVIIRILAIIPGAHRRVDTHRITARQITANLLIMAGSHPTMAAASHQTMVAASHQTMAANRLTMVAGHPIMVGDRLAVEVAVNHPTEGAEVSLLEAGVAENPRPEAEAEAENRRVAAVVRSAKPDRNC